MRTNSTETDNAEAQRAQSRRRSRGNEYLPPRVFWKKRLEDVDLIGVDFFGADKEAASVSK